MKKWENPELMNLSLVNTNESEYCECGCNGVEEITDLLDQDSASYGRCKKCGKPHYGNCKPNVS